MTSGLFSRAKVRTAAVYSKHDVSVKAVEMGHISILQRPRTLWSICYYSQNIETDVRAPEDTNPPHEEHLRNFTKRLCNLQSTPVILPLFKKLHDTPEEDTITEAAGQSNLYHQKTGIMNVKLLQILSNDPKFPAEKNVQLLSFSDTEREQVERTTVKQWQCEEWYLHKAGFITASKCKSVFTRQETLDKNPAENARNLVEEIGLVKSYPPPGGKRTMKCQGLGVVT